MSVVLQSPLTILVKRACQAFRTPASTQRYLLYFPKSNGEPVYTVEQACDFSGVFSFVFF